MICIEKDCNGIIDDNDDNAITIQTGCSRTRLAYACKKRNLIFIILIVAIIFLTLCLAFYAIRKARSPKLNTSEITLERESGIIQNIIQEGGDNKEFQEGDNNITDNISVNYMTIQFADSNGNINIDDIPKIKVPVSVKIFAK